LYYQIEAGSRRTIYKFSSSPEVFTVLELASIKLLPRF